MHCSLKSSSLNDDCIFTNLSELLRTLLSARYKYRLHSRNSIFVIIADTTRLWQSFYLSQNISLLSSPAYSPTKRIVRKALSFSTAMVNIWLLFKRAYLVDSTHTLSISVFAKKSSNNSCDNRVFSVTFFCLSRRLGRRLEDVLKTF